jgi:hypothetical protein
MDTRANGQSALGGREQPAPLYVEIADVKGEGHFTIPASVYSLIGDLVALKVTQMPETLVHEHLKGRFALVWLNGGQGVMEVAGQVRWLKELGVKRSFLIGVELRGLQEGVENALLAATMGGPQDTLDLWNRWEATRTRGAESETDYRDAYLIGLTLMLVGFFMPFVGVKVPVILNYASILLGGLGIGARGYWRLRQSKVNTA